MPKLHQATLRQHFDHFRALCAQADEPASQAERAAWVARVELEIGNILTALETAIQGIVEPEEAWRLALPLRTLIERRGRPQIWIPPLEALLEATEDKLSPQTASLAHTLLADVRYGLREIRATHAHALKAIEWADRTDDPKLQIETRANLVTPALTLGDFDQAQRILEEAISRLDDSADAATAAKCYLNLGWVIFDGGREEESEARFAQAVELARSSGEGPVLGSAITGLACAVAQSRYEEAEPLFEEAAQIWRRISMPSYLAHLHYYRSLLDYRHGDLQTAHANLREAFRIYMRNKISLGQTILTITGNTLARMGRLEEAGAAWSKADAARERQGMRMMPSMRRDYDREQAEIAAQGKEEIVRQAGEAAAAMTDAELAEHLFGIVG
jgi:tetratricopeptide (TPR) repeat protein